MPWINEFRNRMNRFGNDLPPDENEIPISIKIRIDSGCYSRGCCPNAYKIIDKKLNELRDKGERFGFEEHETGPEILVYLAVTAAGLGLAKSIIEFITVIIKARSEGRRKGDHHDDPITLVVRRLQSRDALVEERLMTFNGDEDVKNEMVERLLIDGCNKLLPKKPVNKPKERSVKSKTRRKRK
jgi:hypothetical protein